MQPYNSVNYQQDLTREIMPVTSMTLCDVNTYYKLLRVSNHVFDIINNPPRQHKCIRPGDIHC